MSLAQILSTYVTLNVLVCIGAAAAALLAFSVSRVSFGTQLRLQYVSLLMILGCTLLHPLLPGHQVFTPAAKVWSAPSIQSFSRDYDFAKSGGYISIPSAGGKTVLSANRIGWISGLLAVLLAICGGLRVWRDLRSLFAIQRGSFLLRRLGNVSVYTHEGITVPFSFWTPGQARVLLPGALLERPRDFRIALAHELQHHRQRDTTWVYALWFLRVACIFNPLMYLWSRRVAELQEFACDEALLTQRKVESRAYASCLVEVAQTAFQQRQIPACATGLTFLVERNLIKRRIEIMLNPSTRKTGKSVVVVFCAVLALVMAASALASKALVQDRRVTLKQAQAMAERANEGTNFPIVVNDLVVAQLNKYVGTPEGRDFMRGSLERMEAYRAMVTGKLTEYRLPMELMAIPIIESGYQNLADRNRKGWGAGLWMFIKSTARNYGLRVDDQVDERLNAELLTDAAMRYLSANQLLLQNWHLAVLGYNIGENNVLRAIERTGSRDAWVLIRNGYENDRDYLPKLMAAVLIMKNPRVLE